MVTAQAAKLVWYGVDCSSFCRDLLGYDVSDKRIAQFLDSQEREIALLWSRQVGKTQGASGKVTHKAIFYPGSLSLIVSASQRQATILQGRVLANIRKLGRPETWDEVSDR